MHIPHELQEEFADESALIARLTETDYLFRRLVSRYGEINLHIYRIESEEEPTTDQVLERLKKQRLRLKDEIARMLMRIEHRM